MIEVFRLVFALLFFTLAACEANVTESSNTLGVQEPLPETPIDQTFCEEPRGQICTRDYRPVCGIDNRGESKTYSNACTACSNPAVLSYLEGNCQ